MEAIVAYIVQLVAGAVGGVGTGKAMKDLDLGNIGNIIAGAIGGVGGTALAGLIPGLQNLVAGGSFSNLGALLGQGVTGLVGGGILTAIAGFVKKAMASR